MRHWSLGAAVLAAFVSGVSCNDDDGSIGEARQPILDGHASPASDDAVLLVYNATAGGVCSGTLIAPNLVSTAHHCLTVTLPLDGYLCGIEGDAGVVTNPPAGIFPGLAPADSLAFFTGPSVPNAGDYPAGTPAAHGLRILTGDSTSVCTNDLAFVVLDTDLTVGTFPLRLGRQVITNEMVSTVGYGWTASRVNEFYSTTRMRRDKVLVEFADWLPGTFTLGVSACHGDSGGPALDQNNALVGVYSIQYPSGTLADCEMRSVVNYYANIAEYPQLVIDAFVDAGQPPPDLRADAGAEPADAGASLDSGTIDADAGGSGGSGGSGGASSGQADGGSTTPETTAKSGCSTGKSPVGGAPLFAFGLAFGALALRGRSRRVKGDRDPQETDPHVVTSKQDRGS